MSDDENHEDPEREEHREQQSLEENSTEDTPDEELLEREPSKETQGSPEVDEGSAQETQDETQESQGKAEGSQDETQKTLEGSEQKRTADFPDDEEEEEHELKIFAVTTPIGQERAAADSMLPRINPARQGIVSLICPTKLRGFILIEAYDVRELKRIVKGVPKVRRVVEGERGITLEEVEKFLTPKPVLEGIRPGNIVELVSGPFKGEKAKVQHVDNDKEEITVELFEAMVPIPVTVKGEHVRLVER